MSLSIVFHGSNAAVFSEGFSERLTHPHRLHRLPDQLDNPSDQKTYAEADIIIGISYNETYPVPSQLKLYHVPGAGYDGIKTTALPQGAKLCNCFGHEQPIAEYVLHAILNRVLPIQTADADLRQGRWTYWAGGSGTMHEEIAGTTIGLLGFGHIGKAIARRAKAFEMQVLAANRSPIHAPDLVDQAFLLKDMDAFWRQADYVICSLPLNGETQSFVNQHSLSLMKKSAVIINVGRGPVIDEGALYDALAGHHIAGAIIDTWYQYPNAQNPHPLPAHKPFHTLPNLIMTPHMSGWTHGTIHRRQHTILDNIERLTRGEPLQNQIL